MTLGVIVSKPFELTQAQAQALVDLEVCCADLGLMMAIRCRICQKIGDPSECEGSNESHPDGTRTFGVNCRCTRRAFRGTLVTPPTPRAVRKPRLDQSVRPTETLSRRQMQIFQSAADALHQLRLAYAMRCLACQLEDRITDGVWGASETNASQFVLECACTRRIYKGADVPLVN